MSAEIPAGTLVLLAPSWGWPTADGQFDLMEVPAIVTAAPMCNDRDGVWEYCDLRGRPLPPIHATSSYRPGTMWRSCRGGEAWVQGKIVNTVWPCLTASTFTPTLEDLLSAQRFVESCP